MNKNQGTIKFYNKEKGFGFIFINESTSDIYFHINDWKNPSIPCGNDDVEFELSNSNNGKAKAVNIKLIKSADAKNQEKYEKNDDRIICPECGKKIIPRITTYKGTPMHSLCPYCGAKVKQFYKGCFIATAVYKDYDHPQVVTLREFRDKHLLTNGIGSLFVKYYYKYSPRFANFIYNKKYWTTPIKVILDFFISIYRYINKI